jgi:hypothetical protein
MIILSKKMWIIIYHTFKLKSIGKIMTYQKKSCII